MIEPLPLAGAWKSPPLAGFLLPENEGQGEVQMKDKT